MKPWDQLPAPHNARTLEVEQGVLDTLDHPGIYSELKPILTCMKPCIKRLTTTIITLILIMYTFMTYENTCRL